MDVINVAYCSVVEAVPPQCDIVIYTLPNSYKTELDVHSLALVVEK